MSERTRRESPRAQALRAYERGRYREGALNALVAILVIAPGVWLAGPSLDAAWPSVVLAALVLGATARGGTFARVALPATLLGLVPLACSLAAARFGHVCTPGGGCWSLCLPLCTVGGGVSGIWLGRLALREAAPAPALGLGIVLSALVGAIGCSCVGIASTAAMAGAILVTSTMTTRLGVRAG